MILEVQLCNIGPFKDKVTFTMEPTSYGGKTENLFTDSKGKPVLTVGVIYGANASGKTNFILALYRLRDELRLPKSWISGIGLAGFYNPYMLDTETKSSPSEILIRFTINEKEFQYSILFNEQEYLSETLCESGQKVFIRKGQNKAQHNVEFSNMETNSGVPRFETVQRNQLVLSQYMSFTGQNDLLCDVAHYLANIQIANGYNDGMRKILWDEVKHWLASDRKRHGRQLELFLNAIDINQNGFAFPTKDDAPFNKIKVRHKLYNAGEETDTLSEFIIEKESHGTKWLLLLGAKVIESLELGLPLFVDELDACYHAQVTQFIIGMYRNPQLNKNGAQLIMTTHNIYLMDERKMRADQIWFVQKDKKGTAELYSLSDFDGITEITPFADWYLARRFGGAPSFTSIANLFESSGK